MILWILAYLGGLLTILSPCILPVLPFVFTRADQPFRRSGLPLLLGMAFTFTFFGALAIVGGQWVSTANEWGRWFALALLTFFGLSLIFPQALEKLMAPLGRIGGKIGPGSNDRSSFSKSFVLGMATGLLWAPCAGPILGLILTGAAVQGSAGRSAGLLLAYALGAGTSLMLALAAGGKLLGSLKKSLKAERWIKGGLGVAVLLGVVAIAFHWDRGLLTRVSRVQTESVEQSLIQKFQPDQAGQSESGFAGLSQIPDLSGAIGWLNSPPLKPDDLKGKVVVVDFWTYSCINCLRSLPHVRAWAETYSSKGLVVIGIHSPEFAFEKVPANVEKAVRDLGIHYPVAIDSDHVIWNRFNNQYWPAHYIFDRKGKLREQHFGEGDYEKSEELIRRLLAEGGPGPSAGQSDRRLDRRSDRPSDKTKGVTSRDPNVLGVESPSLKTQVASPETYIGSARSENQVRGSRPLALNQWRLSGGWKQGEEQATLVKPHGTISYRFHARDLHLVLGPDHPGTKVRFRVKIDGHEPGKDHGVDTDEHGLGVVRENRLYQLVRLKERVRDHDFEIEFLDPEVQAFAFTFG